MFPKSVNIENDLLVSLISGDWKAFGQLYHTYKPMLTAFTNRYIKDKDETEEIIQDVFLRIWEQRENIDVNLSFKSYLFTITKNKITDYFRKTKLTLLYQNYVQHFIELVQETDNYPYSGKEVNDALYGAIKKLPEKRKIIFLLSKKFNLSRHEIAEFMGISENTVKNQLLEAMHFLREHLKNEVIICITLANLKYILFI
jgi:RNA polymerase sigma-70 factor (family 1)